MKIKIEIEIDTNNKKDTDQVSELIEHLQKLQKALEK